MTMLLKICTAWVSFGVWATVLGRQFICPEENGAFPNPEECISWYNCSNNRPNLNVCPGGLNFNPHTLLCDWPSMSECKIGSTSYHPVELYRLGTYQGHVKCPNDRCHCSLPHESDCEKFYGCFEGKAYLMSCSRGLYFNLEKNTCDYPDRTNCRVRESEADPVCKTNNELLPDPSDCTSFYTCVEGIAYLEYCPDGFHFDPRILTCQEPSRAGCVQTTETEESPLSTTTTTLITTIPTTNSPITKFECPHAQGVYPNPLDCSSYYHCSYYQANLQYCPGKLHFNRVLLTCDWPENAGCKTGVVRSISFKLNSPSKNCHCDSCIYAHPEDCNKYYRCINKKAYLSACSGGLVFNGAIENCDLSRNVNCKDNSSTQDKPDAGFQCPQFQGIFSNPKDCGSFYLCDYGIPFLKFCPANLHFNPQLHVCDWPKNVDCKATPPPPPPPPPSKDTSARCHCNTCLLPHPSNCSSYFRCVRNTAYEQTCSEGLLFNTEINNCDFQSNVKCPNPSVLPSKNYKCPKASGLFPNPKDCGSFYHCAHNVPYFKLCPDRLHFNRKKLVCDWPNKAGCEDGNVEKLPLVPVNATCSCTCCVIPDVDDCNKYFTCNDRILSQLSCSDGLQFNSRSKTCEEKGTFKCETGEPENFSCPKARGIFANSKDCRSFYKCAAGVAVLHHCPPGNYYNDTFKVCEHRNLSTCKSPEDADNICSEGDGIYKNPEDCRTFYLCSNNRPYKMFCPSNLHYNAKTRRCDYPHLAGCLETRPITVTPTKSPINPSLSCQHGQLLSHPDCTKFYRCVRGTTVVKSCPSRLHFNPIKKLCDHPQVAGCTSKPEPKPNENTEDCSNEQDYLSHPTDCTKFYQCSNGRPILQNCPQDLHFNPTKKVCDWPNDAGCKDRVQPEKPDNTWKCPKPTGLFPNPVSCQSFYHCSHNTAYLKACPANLHFNPILLVCDWPDHARCGDVPEKEVSIVSPNEKPIGITVCTDANDSCKRIAHPTNCNEFYQCKDGKAYLRKCPTSLRFNKNNEMCDLISNVSC